MNPPTEPTSTTSIDDLPSEMIGELFEYLPPKDLVACSLVNKRWHSIYSNFKLHRLAVIYYRYSRRPCKMFGFDPRKWYNSNRIIEEAGRCRPAIFGHLAEKPLLSELNHLVICGYGFEFDLNKLNRFRQLVHLEFGTFYSEKKFYVNFPRLKVLAFHEWNACVRVQTDCPLLSTLLYFGESENSKLLEMKQPERVRKLETYMVGSKLAQFKNVEWLVTENSKAISKTTLLTLPRLRELHYNVQIEEVFVNESSNGIGSVDRVKRTLNEFLSEAKKLKGSDFRFRFAGLQLTKSTLDQINFGVQVDEESGSEYVHNEYVYMKNYQLVEPSAVPFIDRVDYSRLLSYVTGEFPRCFSQKFTDIEEVVATDEVKDDDRFLWLLKSLKSLRVLELELEFTGLSQEFYDQLPESANSLSKLILKATGSRNELQLNVDFIGKISSLSQLSIKPPLSLESLLSLVRWIDKLEGGDFDVRSREKDFRVRKASDSIEWSIFKPYKPNKYQPPFKFENPQEIVNFFEGIQTLESSESD